MADFEGDILQPSPDKMRRLEKEVRRLQVDNELKDATITELRKIIDEQKEEIKHQKAEARKFRLLNHEKLRKIKGSVETKSIDQGTRDGPLVEEKSTGDTPFSIED